MIIGQDCVTGVFGPHLHFEIRRESRIDRQALELTDPGYWPGVQQDHGVSYIRDNYLAPSQFLLGIFRDDFELGDESLWLQSAEKAGTTLRFADDFNDGVFDPSKWVWTGRTVRETAGELHVDREVTDAGGGADTVAFPIARSGLIVVTRRTKVFAANEQFDGSLIFVPGGIEEARFGVSYANYNYSGNGECPVHGFALYRKNANSHVCANQGVDVTEWIPGVWGDWFEERLEYDPETGELAYWINGVPRLSLNVGPLPASASTLQLRLSTWGWYTGHYQHTDDLMVEQQAP